MQDNLDSFNLNSSPPCKNIEPDFGYLSSQTPFSFQSAVTSETGSFENELNFIQNNKINIDCQSEHDEWTVTEPFPSLNLSPNSKPLFKTYGSITRIEELFFPQDCSLRFGNCEVVNSTQIPKLTKTKSWNLTSYTERIFDPSFSSNQETFIVSHTLENLPRFSKSFNPISQFNQVSTSQSNQQFVPQPNQLITQPNQLITQPNQVSTSQSNQPFVAQPLWMIGKRNCWCPPEKPCKYCKDHSQGKKKLHRACSFRPESLKKSKKKNLRRISTSYL